MSKKEFDLAKWNFEVFFARDHAESEKALDDASSVLKSGIRELANEVYNHNSKKCKSIDNNETLEIAIVDQDGCGYFIENPVLQASYKNKNKEKNSFLPEIWKDKRPDVIVNGSARELSYSSELGNASKSDYTDNEFPRQVSDVNLFNYAKEHEIRYERMPYWNIVKGIPASINATPNQSEEEEDALHFGKDKVELLLAKCHHLSAKYPDKQLNITFLDDKESILNNSKSYFEKNPDKLPKNVTLNFYKYAVYNNLDKEEERIGSVKGSGETISNTVELQETIRNVRKYLKREKVEKEIRQIRENCPNLFFVESDLKSLSYDNLVYVKDTLKLLENSQKSLIFAYQIGTTPGVSAAQEALYAIDNIKQLGLNIALRKIEPFEKHEEKELYNKAVDAIWGADDIQTKHKAFKNKISNGPENSENYKSERSLTHSSSKKQILDNLREGLKEIKSEIALQKFEDEFNKVNNKTLSHHRFSFFSDSSTRSSIAAKTMIEEKRMELRYEKVGLRK